VTQLVNAKLGRSASTISREVSRNGGSDRYRASRSDQAAWDRALRPKLCKLACRPFPEPDSIDQAATAMVNGNHPVSSTAVAV